ncbi:hypothetical protein DOY81_013124, partial [Sarcophaga bullata]
MKQKNLKTKQKILFEAENLKVEKNFYLLNKNLSKLNDKRKCPP